MTSQNPARKPRIALMGEFSAGKSTLANLLLEQAASPVQVTATQLPPVWYRWGDPAATRTDMDGQTETLDPDNWGPISPDTTRLVSVETRTPFLEASDLIDMPGTSDPNMAPDIWEDILPEVDLVIWCTPATQAWRQSEAALWDHVPPNLWENSLLLITRMDKMRSDRDKARVLLRVRREAEGLFRDVLPAALPQALAASGDPEILQQTGATTLITRIADVLDSLQKHDVPPPRAARPAPPEDHTAQDAATPDGPVIMPRRILRSTDSKRRPRPEHHAS